MKTLVDWGWPIGLALIIVGLITSFVLDIRSTFTGRPAASVGGLMAIVGVLVLFVMLFIPASWQPL